MHLPPNLQKLIDNALVAIQNQSEFDLNQSYRISIFDFFDALPNLNGRIARTHLLIMVTKKVLHVWDSMPEEYGYTSMPKLMVSISEQLLSHLHGGMTAEELNELAKKIKVKVIYGTEMKPIETYTETAITLAELAEEMDSLTGELTTSLYYNAWCVFLTAMNTLHEALGWKWWNNNVVELAAQAYAGGTWSAFEEQDQNEIVPQGTWSYSSLDVWTKRSEFWEWWYKEAVPAAWKMQANKVS